MNKQFKIRVREQKHPECFSSNEFGVSIIDEREVIFPEHYVFSSNPGNGYIRLTQSRYTELDNPNSVDPEMNRRHFGTAYSRESAEELLYTKAFLIAEELAGEYGSDGDTAEVLDLTERARRQ